MKARRSSPPRAIVDILRTRFRDLGWEQKMKEQELLHRWEEVVGPRIARHARPGDLARGRLTVVAESPVWAQQLSLLKKELLRRIAERHAPGLVRELYFVTGPLERKRREKAAPAAQPPPLSEEERRHFESIAAGIPDEELRLAFRRILEASRRSAGPAP